MGSLLGLLTLLLGGDNSWLDVWIVFLWLHDLDGIWHDLLVFANANFGSLHDLDLETENTLTELNTTDGLVDEIVLWLTSGDLVTHGVLLSLGTLATDLTGDDNFATDSTTTAHDGSEDVVSGKTDWGSVQKLVLKSLDVGSSAEVLVVWESLDSEIDLVALVVEVVSLLNKGFDLLDLTGLLLEEVSCLGATHTNLSTHTGKTHLNASVSVNTKRSGEELVELSLEDSVSDELLLGVHLSHNFLVSHR